jgi:hypothetical protein
MKTKKQIEIEISEIIKECENELKEKEITIKKEKRIKKSRDKKISELRKIIRYIESNPSEKFINSEIERISNLLDKKGEGKESEKIYPVKEWKMQLKTLKYILH